MRFTKVHLAALAFVAGVLPAAVSADGWFSRAGETKDVTLTEILKNPREYVDVEVEFKVYFNETGKNFNPYFTQFSEEQYGNFSAWPIDARLYDKRDFPRPYPFFFASKFTKAWKKVKDVDHLRVIEVTAVELEDVAARGPSVPELSRAKAQLKAGLLMSLESSSARAEQMARHLLAHGRIVGSDELIRNVDAVSVEDVGRFAQDLSARTPSVAVVGAGKASQRLASEALQRMTRGSVSSEAKTA